MAEVHELLPSALCEEPYKLSDLQIMFSFFSTYILNLNPDFRFIINIPATCRKQNSMKSCFILVYCRNPYVSVYFHFFTSSDL